MGTLIGTKNNTISTDSTHKTNHFGNKLISYHWDWGPHVYVGKKWGVYMCGPYLLVIFLGFDIWVEELWMVLT